MEDEINFILNNNVTDIDVIDKTFDKLIDLTYHFGEDIKDLYYSLLNYCKEINKDISQEYENIYLKIINEE